MITRKEVTVVASRTLALLFAVWALSDASYLPETVESLLRSISRPSPSVHYYVIRVGFFATRIIGFSFLARWLFRGGSEVEELLLPSEAQESPGPK